ncbi:MAG: CaiB/BaiF CoA-transferase family protein, partial [Thermoanaerobaculia bacterium]|nr:CaiB/BaiF CoA-transferase family protein [Thermoanaerobaculia bacterium]
MANPLDGLTVVDLGTPTPGKYATFLLADLGASVVRVERPGSREEPVSDEDRVLNRGKRSIGLDLRRPAGQEVLHRLVVGVDVLIESYRPGVTERLGADWTTLSRINPRLVYCSLSGFGQTGPDRSLPAYDLNFAALSGLLSALCGGDQPPRVPDAYVADGVSGLVATIAVAVALLERERNGAGRWLDLAMLDSAFALLGVFHGLGPRAAGGAHGAAGASPLYSVYACADGRYVAVAAIRPASTELLCDELGRPELAAKARAGEGEAVAAGLAAAFATAPAAEWVERLRAKAIEIAAVNRPDEAFSDPQLVDRGLQLLGARGDPALQLVAALFQRAVAGREKARLAQRHTELMGERSQQQRE